MLELTTEIGVLVNLATSSWTYPIPKTFPKGDPKEESYQKWRSRLHEKFQWGETACPFVALTSSQILPTLQQ